ncbi:MAG TPA: hypothetical protein VGN42_00800 [Pirellulales bacterium]|nr:hypothetical protein [Pirellulales bacterium]
MSTVSPLLSTGPNGGRCQAAFFDKPAQGASPALCGLCRFSVSEKTVDQPLRFRDRLCFSITTLQPPHVTLKHKPTGLIFGPDGRYSHATAPNPTQVVSLIVGGSAYLVVSGRSRTIINRFFRELSIRSRAAGAQRHRGGDSQLVAGSPRCVGDFH